MYCTGNPAEVQAILRLLLATTLFAQKIVSLINPYFYSGYSMRGVYAFIVYTVTQPPPFLFKRKRGIIN